MSAYIPPVSRLSARVIRILGCNAGPLTLQGTNTYLIGTGKRRILLDTGNANVSQYVSNLEAVLKEENVSIQKIIITHWHPDHIGGVPNVVKLIGNCELTKFKREDLPEDSKICDIPVRFLQDKECIETEGATLKVYHTPGHTTDHIVLVLKEENAIFSGDTILGEGTTVFEDLYTYMKSLELILNLQPEIMYPGHGPVIENPIPKIKFYIQHRIQREEQIIEFLKQNIGKKVAPAEIVKHVYKETPKNLHEAAAINVRHHLSKLEKEGKVRSEDDKWFLSLLKSDL